MKKIIYLSLLSVVLPLTLQACNANQSTTRTEPAKPAETTVTTTKTVETPQTATVAQRAEGLWIDVRSPEEYKEGHLSDTINIPHTEIAQKISEFAPNKDQPIHVYCRSGRRSEIALQELKKLGYTNITNQGAYDDLVKKGLK